MHDPSADLLRSLREELVSVDRTVYRVADRLRQFVGNDHPAQRAAGRAGAALDEACEQMLRAARILEGEISR